ncbi:MAG: hypothetical protein WEF50_21830 [Myxococcota bacterium]
MLAKFYPDRGNFISLVGNLGQVALAQQVKAAMKESSPLPVESIVAPASLAGVDDSDHRKTCPTPSTTRGWRRSCSAFTGRSGRWPRKTDAG